MTNIRIFQTLLLVRQATDDYLSLPDNSTEEDKRRMIVYVGAMCKLLLLDMEKHAGIHWSKKMERAAGINLVEMTTVEISGDGASERKQMGRETDSQPPIQADKKESA